MITLTIIKFIGLFIISKVLNFCDWSIIFKDLKYFFHILYGILLCDIIRLYDLINFVINVNYFKLLVITNDILIIIILAKIIQKNKKTIVLLMLNILLGMLNDVFNFALFLKKMIE